MKEEMASVDFAFLVRKMKIMPYLPGRALKRAEGTVSVDFYPTAGHRTDTRKPVLVSLPFRLYSFFSF
jgi:hypothetical protein